MGLETALAHGLIGGELDHGVDAGVLVEQLFGGGTVGEVHIHKLEVLAGDLAHPAHGFLTGIVEIVGHNDLIASLQKLHTGVAADIAGAAAYQNRHNASLSLNLYLPRRPSADASNLPFRPLSGPCLVFIVPFPPGGGNRLLAVWFAQLCFLHFSVCRFSGPGFSPKKRIPRGSCR